MKSFTLYMLFLIVSILAASGVPLRVVEPEASPSKIRVMGLQEIKFRVGSESKSLGLSPQEDGRSLVKEEGVSFPLSSKVEEIQQQCDALERKIEERKRHGNSDKARGQVD